MRDTYHAAGIADPPDDFFRRRQRGGAYVALQWSAKRSGAFKTASARF
ncbi:hypothetical protein B0G62_101167 [Paraburkholderia eburnea]|uniref:Uncharacterized protein n=1 Tax=Paraburkholderia eburnea TaxID=1189126 RepID=A0A2S4MM00_9BURK|nr:hypothetical protein B0G62_101167 [Paraburkholderia eburnea]